MSTTIPRAEFFFVVEELVLLGEVVLWVPLEVPLLLDEEPEEPGVLVGAGVAKPKLSDMKEKSPFTNTHCQRLLPRSQSCWHTPGSH
jgi:hypothetical protein